MMKYSFFPGCSLESTAQDFQMSTLAVAKASGSSWKRFRTGPAAARLPRTRPMRCWRPRFPRGTWRSPGAGAGCGRLLRGVLRPARGGEPGSCRGCRACARKWPRRSAASMRAASGCGTSCRCCARISGWLRSRTRSRSSLSGLKVACYYGCLLTRPKELSILDDPEDPQLMEETLCCCGRGARSSGHTRPSAAARASRSPAPTR